MHDHLIPSNSLCRICSGDVFENLDNNFQTIKLLVTCYYFLCQKLNKCNLSSLKVHIEIEGITPNGCVFLDFEIIKYFYSLADISLRDLEGKQWVFLYDKLHLKSKTLLTVDFVLLTNRNISTNFPVAQEMSCQKVRGLIGFPPQVCLYVPSSQRLDRRACSEHYYVPRELHAGLLICSPVVSCKRDNLCATHVFFSCPIDSLISHSWIFLFTPKMSPGCGMSLMSPWCLGITNRVISHLPILRVFLSYKLLQPVVRQHSLGILTVP